MTQSTLHSSTGTVSKDGSDTANREDIRFLSPTSRQSGKSSQMNFANMSYTEIMNAKWVTEMKSKIPAMDVEDARMQRNITEDKRRQTAPEYSQHAYLYMMSKEKAFGNYFLENNNLKIEPADRESMVSLIQELHRVKEYSEETFY